MVVPLHGVPESRVVLIGIMLYERCEVGFEVREVEEAFIYGTNTSPHLLVLAIIELFLSAGGIFRAILTSESH
jgi:hypothetical protein